MHVAVLHTTNIFCRRIFCFSTCMGKYATKYVSKRPYNDFNEQKNVEHHIFLFVQIVIWPFGYILGRFVSMFMFFQFYMLDYQQSLATAMSSDSLMCIVYQAVVFSLSSICLSRLVEVYFSAYFFILLEIHMFVLLICACSSQCTTHFAHTLFCN